MVKGWENGLSMEEDKRLRPLVYTSKSFYPFIGALSVLVLLALYAFWVTLDVGPGVTGLDNLTIWGVYIVSFIFYAGISLAGIAISAAVHVVGLKEYTPIVRIFEVLTFASLIVGTLNIVVDLGGPYRVFLIIIHFFPRVETSTMTWDITAVAAYFILSLTFLYFSLREDLKLCQRHCSGWRAILYSLLTPLYHEDEGPIIRRVLYVLAAMLLPIMVMFHTIVSWILGLNPSRPLWYGSVMGPYFISAAITSGIAAVILISVFCRELFHWEEYFTNHMYQGLGNFLAINILIYLYFMLCDAFTVLYAGPTLDHMVTVEMLFGSFAVIYWPMVIFGMVIPFLYFIYQGFVKPEHVNVRMIALLSFLVVAAFWVKRYLIVVPTLTLGVIKIYSPSWIEVTISIGLLALLILIITLLIKIFPILDLGGLENA